MRFRGKEYTGKGVTVAIIDSGVDTSDPRLQGVEIEGWSIRLGATGHALLSSDFKDENGHGTEIAAAVLTMAPDVRIHAVKITGKRLSTSSELMAAGIETSARNGAHLVNLSLGTEDMGKALLLRDCCANAVEAGAVVLAAAHPQGKPVYPAELPETIGVAAHRDCPIDKYFYFDPKRYPKKTWQVLSDKFLTHGYPRRADGSQGKYIGPGIATAYLTGIAACLAEALGGRNATALIETLKRTALVPLPDVGYS